MACLGVSSATPVPGTNALSGSAGYESDAGAIVLVRGLELQGAQLTNAAQHHWQHKAVQPSRFCTARVFACNLAVRLSQKSVLRHSAGLPPACCKSLRDFDVTYIPHFWANRVIKLDNFTSGELS